MCATRDGTSRMRWPPSRRSSGGRKRPARRSSPSPSRRLGGGSPRTSDASASRRGPTTSRSVWSTPAVARRLYHGHDLDECFDFLTWFEYAPQNAPVFEELVSRLRATPEWEYVDREV